MAFNPVGQVVGMMKEIRSCREVIYDLVEDYFAATERLSGLAPR